MDRFKFRYFNKLSNKMVEPKNWQNIDSIFECLKQQVCYDNDISFLPYNHIGNGLVFMQCTGLKDKNRKLIYEGDIVKFKFGNGYRNGKVEYSQTIWSISNAKFINRAYIGGALINMYSESEIIGNIYENPELLKEVKE